MEGAEGLRPDGGVWGSAEDRRQEVTKVGEVEVRGLPEGAVFSPDGKYLYVGNFLDSDGSILKMARW